MMEWKRFCEQKYDEKHELTAKSELKGVLSFWNEIILSMCQLFETLDQEMIVNESNWSFRHSRVFEWFIGPHSRWWLFCILSDWNPSFHWILDTSFWECTRITASKKAIGIPHDERIQGINFQLIVIHLLKLFTEFKFLLKLRTYLSLYHFRSFSRSFTFKDFAIKSCNFFLANT